MSVSSVVLISNELKNELSRSDFRKLEKFKSRFEQYSDGLKENYLSSHHQGGSRNLYVKNLQQDIYIVIQKIVRNGIIIYLIRKTFDKEDRINIANARNNPNVWLKENPISENDKNEIKDIVARLVQQQTLKKKIPSRLFPWLKKVTFSYDVTFYESKEWQEKIISGFETKLETIINLLTTIGNEKAAPNSLKINDIDVDYLERNKCIVFYKTVSSPKTGRVVYYLITLSLKQAENINYISLLENIDIPKNYDELVEKSVRAYPYWLLSDEELWLEVEGIRKKSLSGKTGILSDVDVSNLALSSEEEELLKQAKLPLFINGQAGSGKTTMLMYLFADLLFRAARSKNIGHPLFLTYSKMLIREIKKGIFNILIKNPNYSDSKNKNLKGKYEDLIEKSCFAFKDFILKYFVKDIEVKSRFSDDSLRLTYSRFKHLYSNINVLKDKQYACFIKQKRRYSPELVWYVIRTFIKGYFPEREMMLEEYDVLTSDEKMTISKDEFIGIYNYIYLKWYKKITREMALPLWDDLDLIRYAVNEVILKGKDYPRFPAIFCDEAQDFTRVELDFIFRLSEFMEYDLSDIFQIPFAFAGDPYQTVNPTGFNWDHLRSTFYSKFKELKFGFTVNRKKNSLLDVKDLDINYRSVENIVKLSNHIQFCRKCLLESYQNVNLKAQRFNRTGGAEPRIYILEDNITKEDLGKYIRESVLLVPEKPLDIESFKTMYRDLAEIYKNKDDDKIMKSVFSSMDLKGMELDKVIVYNFGEYAYQLLNGSIHDLNDVEKTKISYFFNNLYVALTRARESLYLLDTKQGYQNFWKYFRDSSNSYYRRNGNVKDKENWPDDSIGYIIKGILPEELEEKDYFKNAENFAQAGRRQGDPQLLLAASEFYHLNGNIKERDQCKAEAYELMEEFKKAGEYWAEIGKLENASDCYWKGKEWKALRKLYSNNFQYLKYREKIAGFMDKPTLDRLVKDILKEEIVQAMITERPWFDILKRIKDIVRAKTKRDNRSKLNYRSVANYLLKFWEKGFDDRELLDLAALTFYLGEDFQNAALYWEKTGSTNIRRYFWAKYFSSTDHVDRIKWLLKLPPKTREKNIYVRSTILKSEKRIRIDKLSLDVGLYFYKYGEYKDAVRFFNHIDTKENIFEYLKAKAELFNKENQKEKEFKWLLKASKFGRKEKSQIENRILKIWNENIKHGKFKNLLSDKEKLILIKILRKNDDIESIMKLVGDFKTVFDWSIVADLIYEGKLKQYKPIDLISTIAKADIDSNVFIEQRRDVKRDGKIEYEKLVSIVEKEFRELKDKRTSPENICLICCAFERVVQKKKEYIPDLIKFYENVYHSDSVPEYLNEWIKKRLYYNLSQKLKNESSAIVKEMINVLGKDTVVYNELNEKNIKINKELKELKRTFGIFQKVDSFPKSVDSESDQKKHDETERISDKNKTTDVSVDELLNKLIKIFEKNDGDNEKKELYNLLKYCIESKDVRKYIWKDSIRKRIEKFCENPGINDLVEETDHVFNAEEINLNNLKGS